MYINAKMIPVETVPGIGKKGFMKEKGFMVEGVNSSMIYSDIL
jgi:hypothetical protein